MHFKHTSATPTTPSRAGNREEKCEGTRTIVALPIDGIEHERVESSEVLKVKLLALLTQSTVPTNRMSIRSDQCREDMI